MREGGGETGALPIVEGTLVFCRFLSPLGDSFTASSLSQKASSADSSDILSALALRATLLGLKRVRANGLTSGSLSLSSNFSSSSEISFLDRLCLWLVRGGVGSEANDAVRFNGRLGITGAGCRFRGELFKMRCIVLKTMRCRAGKLGRPAGQDRDCFVPLCHKGALAKISIISVYIIIIRIYLRYSFFADDPSGATSCLPSFAIDRLAFSHHSRSFLRLSLIYSLFLIKNSPTVTHRASLYLKLLNHDVDVPFRRPVHRPS